MGLSDFAPLASLEVLRQRARLLSITRRFFEHHGYLEVETPLLSPDVVVDTHLEPFSTQFLPNPTSRTGSELFLQTSPEFSLKRLLASGSGPVFEVFRAFRNGERGRLHNPEFTLIEWYRPGDTHHDQMTFTENYVREFLREAAALRCGGPPSPSPWGEGQGVRGVSERHADLCTRTETPDRPQPVGFGAISINGSFERLTYDDAFLRFTGQRVLRTPIQDLERLARERDIAIPSNLKAIEADRDAWLNLLLAELVEPHLGVDRPTFLYDYPASLSALAKVRAGDPPVAERFELYINGIELCNGYHELLEAKELRRRNQEQNLKRQALGLRTLPEDSRLLAAMEHGLPACAGVALGFDRLVMIALGKTTIGEVRAFLTESIPHKASSTIP